MCFHLENWPQPLKVPCIMDQLKRVGPKVYTVNISREILAAVLNRKGFMSHVHVLLNS